MINSYPEISEINKAIVKIGVLSDTHVPDRVRNLHPGLSKVFETEKVDLILHAGDICYQPVLEKLKKVAPVIAVRGNRDFLFPRELPKVARIELAGLKLAIMHGHGGMKNYWIDKVGYLLQGYRLERYLPVVLNTCPESDIIIFGHTHYAVADWYNGKFIMNPGTAGLVHHGKRPSVGILTIEKEKGVRGKIMVLQGAKLKNHLWKSDQDTSAK